MGFSLGGSFSILYSLLKKDSVQGIILFSPMINFHDKYKPSIFAVTLLKIFNFILPKSRLLPTSSDEILSNGYSDPAYCEFDQTDILIYKGRFPLRTGSVLLEIIEYLKVNINSVDIPTLIFQGDKDNVIDSDAVDDFFYKNIF